MNLEACYWANCVPMGKWEDHSFTNESKLNSEEFKFVFVKQILLIISTCPPKDSVMFKKKKT